MQLEVKKVNPLEIWISLLSEIIEDLIDEMCRYKLL